MKSFLAIPALFALGAIAGSDSTWGFTWTFSSGHSTWTSCTYASANATTATSAAASNTAWSEWTSTTSYTATYSSGASTWTIPTSVSYSVASNWTSMIPAPTSSSVYSSEVAPTTAAPATSVEASKTSAVPSAFTGAATPNVNGKIAGMGAVAIAGLALVL
ncbi:uncharacterized protein Z519_11331 [Cladophialophora bantiana CBS 173.52]|uniref:Uncharacterized protein n=1 Tax=Cladophialophora bantiana (strain ATCC 10958 / CBS 173.52 / CDC B-1940 / NIH 8579) TaxID=1442370 RepID=A0A0D2HBB5_CLAB1|nr:uncharacterized protein Z519_11331 [Cladophialophora bantiana CBS 173.52]KIW88220.1 hypothetical protein Z519_11331 [Cladophialophora bantiana CBS 173.52]